MRCVSNEWRTLTFRRTNVHLNLSTGLTKRTVFWSNQVRTSYTNATEVAEMELIPETRIFKSKDQCYQSVESSNLVDITLVDTCS